MCVLKKLGSAQSGMLYSLCYAKRVMLCSVSSVGCALLSVNALLSVLFSAQFVVFCSVCCALLSVLCSAQCVMLLAVCYALLSVIIPYRYWDFSFKNEDCVIVPVVPHPHI